MAGTCDTYHMIQLIQFYKIGQLQRSHTNDILNRNGLHYIISGYFIFRKGFLIPDKRILINFPFTFFFLRVLNGHQTSSLYILHFETFSIFRKNAPGGIRGANRHSDCLRIVFTLLSTRNEK